MERKKSKYCNEYCFSGTLEMLKTVSKEHISKWQNSNLLMLLFSYNLNVNNLHNFLTILVPSFINLLLKLYF